jgi:uncharacterized membrane protein
MEKSFSVSTALRQAWEAFKPNAWVLIGMMIGYVILSTIINSILGIIPPTIGLPLSLLVSMFLSVTFSLGYYKMCLDSIDGEEPQFSAFSEQIPRFFNGFLAVIIMAVIISIGCVLLLLPGIYLGIRLQFTLLAIVNEDKNAIDALKRSWELTSGNSLLLPFILFVLTSIGLAMLGVIALGIGLLIAGPVIQLTQVCIYKTLKEQTGIPLTEEE